MQTFIWTGAGMVENHREATLVQTKFVKKLSRARDAKATIPHTIPGHQLPTVVNQSLLREARLSKSHAFFGEESSTFLPTISKSFHVVGRIPFYCLYCSSSAEEVLSRHLTLNNPHSIHYQLPQQSWSDTWVYAEGGQLFLSS